MAKPQEKKSHKRALIETAAEEKGEKLDLNKKESRAKPDKPNFMAPFKQLWVDLDGRLKAGLKIFAGVVAIIIIAYLTIHTYNWWVGPAPIAPEQVIAGNGSDAVLKQLGTMEGNFTTKIGEVKTVAEQANESAAKAFALAQQANATASAAAAGESLDVNKQADEKADEEIVDLPALEVVGGKTVSKWRDSEGLPEQITLGGDVLAMQGDSNDRVGAIDWDSFRDSDTDIQDAFQVAKEDYMGDFLINRIPVWADDVLRYENDDGDVVALLIRVDDLDYRLWKITTTARSLPSAKDDLRDIVEDEQEPETSGAGKTTGNARTLPSLRSATA